MSKNFKEQVGRRLKALRIEKGFTQQELSVQCKVAQPTIAHWESGYRLPSYETLIALVKLYGTSSDRLLGLKE